MDDLRLPQSQLVVRDDQLLNLDKHGETLATHSLRDIRDVRIEKRISWFFPGVLIAGSLALAYVSYTYLPGGVLAWAATIFFVLLAGFWCCAIVQPHLVIETPNGPVAFPLLDDAQRGEAFVESLQQILSDMANVPDLEHPAFGTLTYRRGTWSGKTTFPANGAEIQICIAADEQGPSDRDAKAYQRLSAEYDEIRADLADSICQILDGLTPSQQVSKDEVLQHVQLVRILVKTEDDVVDATILWFDPQLGNGYLIHEMALYNELEGWSVGGMAVPAEMCG